MSKKQHIKLLNREIQKLNGIIDLKILGDRDYRREARRHKRLLAQLRREEMQRILSRSVRSLIPLWR